MVSVSVYRRPSTGQWRKDPVYDLLRVDQTALKMAWVASPVGMLIYHS
jgi:hypothetical protein